MAVYDGRNELLEVRLKSNVGAPGICYHPLKGLWLEKPPDKKAQRLEDDGEYEDGFF
jgi:hypothetical protein